MEDAVLVLDGVSKKFSAFALETISFAIRPGSVTGLLGPNGAGKTTTIKLIINLLHPDTGRITVLGLDSRKQEIAIKRNLGYLGEQPILPPQATAKWLGEFLALCYPTWDHALYRDYLSRFGVPLDVSAKALSRGTRVKLGLAAAMGHTPRLLILDEPTSGLDPMVRHEVVTAIQEVAASGRRSVLFSSHIVSDLQTAADWVVILNNGRLVINESVSSLQGRWQKLSFTVTERISPNLTATIHSFLEGKWEGPTFFGVTDHCDAELLARLERETQASVSVAPVSLEEVFRFAVESSAAR